MLERLRLIVLRFVPSPVLRLIEGFWATPLVLSMLGIALAAATQLVPASTVGEGWIRYFEGIDVAGTRSALSVIAGGMVSLVTLVFSLTFVALSITAQQLSPRILDFVLREGSAQALLGLALTTLLYAAIVLSMGDARGAWRLGMAMPPALVLAAASLIMVVLFAHRMTRVMRAEELVARLGGEFVGDIHVLLKPPAGCVVCAHDPAEAEAEFDEARVISARQAGYVGTVDYADLLDIASAKDLKIALKVSESDFLLPGMEIARVLGLHDGDDDPAPAIEAALNLTDRREATDTAGYEAAALCEAALRALSPGINDPATAISCLNRLFEGLAVMASNDPPPRLLAAAEDGAELGAEDEAGQVWRLLRPAREVPKFLTEAVVPIIRAARGDQRVLARIDALAEQLEEIVERPRERAAITELRESVAAEA